VDVVRVKLLATTDLHAADIRVGHMEVKATVPEGGIGCDLPVAKSADPTSVGVGKPFTTTITVTNPFDCPLASVTVHDAIHVDRSARFEITSTSPTGNGTAGDNLSEGTIDWSLGTIPAHGHRTVTATFTAQGGEGEIIDVAEATGDIGACTGGATSVAGVSSSIVGASVGGTSAQVVVPVSSVLGKIVSRDQLPATGVEDLVMLVAGTMLVLFSGLLIRMLRRSA
jgi:LPXTG-motif cell wall-anchored protein